MATERAAYPPRHTGGFVCAVCGGDSWRLHRVATHHSAAHETLAFKGCADCGTLHSTHLAVAKAEADALDVGKTIDSTETAVQRGAGPKVVGHRSNCPRGGSAPCGAAVDGRCGICRAPVQDHEALGKSVDDTVALLRKRADER